MAEEKEKKAGVVLHKKSAAPKAAEPKSADGAQAAAAPVEKKKKVVLIKKRSASAAPAGAAPSASAAAKTQEAASQAVPEEKKVSAQKEAAADSKAAPAPAKRQASSFSLNSARPNVKAGNLSDHSKGSWGRGGQAGGRGSFGGGQGRPSGGSGFTGAQARAGYQNRERDNKGGPGAFNRGGQGGGFNRGSGGFNRGGQGGGFNRGPGGFGARPGSGFGGGAGGGSFAPGGMTGGKPSQNAPKKSFKGKKQQYSRKDKEEAFDEDKFYESQKKAETQVSDVPKSIDIMETVSISDLARKMNLKANEIIAKLMSMGQMVTITQSIDSDTATLLAAEYNCEVHLVSLYDETVIARDTSNDDKQEPRPPIVTVMGHVDHGKTKTLDAIRHSHVAEGEAGGITQSIGAYSVRTEKGTITFLDTPGHEVFTMMRARGAQITDIVVLVVAADDGVMPQTLEAVNHAKDAKVPIIVAVNKIDKPDANPDRVRTQLTELGLTPEDWGGDTQYVNISALKGEGIDDLLDAILLQAEMLELKTVWDCRAEGKVLESRIDQGRGVVSTVIVERGTLHQGDPFVAGIYSGRVRAMFNDRGKRIQEATPSQPVEVIGIEEMPNAGDPFQVTESEKEARAISTKRVELKRFEDAKAVKKVTLDNLYQTIDAHEVKELKVVIKADLQGSAEALKVALEKLSTKDIRLVVIHSSAGAINESDVILAAADSNAIIVGFNVRPTPKAKLLADQEKVEIRKYSIIYECVNEITAAMEGMLSPDTKEQVIGTVEVQNTFKVPKIGTIAGCYVSDGSIKRNCGVRLIREGIVIYTGKVSSLKRFKDDAKEVAKGYECGVGLENWQDIHVGDQIECFEYIEVARKLGDALIDDKSKNEAAAAEQRSEAEAKAAAEAAAEAEKIAAEKAAARARKEAAEAKPGAHGINPHKAAEGQEGNA
ncbi:MAG: translation initiation factor IF-2 [Treponema sp.]|nr:translation initiation factor IF-2 [Treponema sp.]